MNQTVKQVSGYKKELLNLSSVSVFRIAQIEWWLLKYEGEYKRIHQIEQSKYLYEIDGEVVRLPDYIGCRTDEEKFIDTYQRLDELTQLHKNEEYFKQEMAIYQKVKNNPDLVQDWLKKNEQFGTKDYILFLTEYLDYIIDNTEYHLKVFFLGDKELEVYVDREDFKYTIEFLEAFNDIYWSLLEELNLDKLS